MDWAGLGWDALMRSLVARSRQGKGERGHDARRQGENKTKPRAHCVILAFLNIFLVCSIFVLFFYFI